MKKSLFALMLGLAVVACQPAEYDHSGLENDIKDLAGRVDALEEDVATLRLNVDAMTTLANALKNGLYITAVTEVTDGYTITFSDGSSITILNGEDGAQGEKGDQGDKGDKGDTGAAGATPTVEVKNVDGELYWFINGEKICPVYEAAPTFTSIDGKLYVQYPGSEELVEIGELVGKSLFDNVIVGENSVEFVLISGGSFEVPLAEPFALEISTTVGLENGQTEVEIPYTVTGATEATVVDVIAFGCEAVVEEGVIKVSAITDGAQLLVFADNGEGKASIKKIVFDAEKYSVEKVDEVIPAEGGQIVVKGISNVPFEVVIPAEATWLTLVETKAESFELTFAAAANEVEEPREAKVALVRAGTETELLSFTIAQEAAVIAKEFATRVAARYSDADGAAWCSFIPNIANRSMASDGKYVYLNSSAAAPAIYAVEIASLLAGDATPAYKALPVEGISGGTHAVSVVEVFPNEAGDPVLIACNLAVDGNENFNIYAYKNGIDANPEMFHAYRWDGVANVGDWRRYGDRISVSGTWQNGTIWAPSQSGTKVMAFHVENGATDADHREYCWFDGFTGGLAEANVYPATGQAILTTASSAAFYTKNANGETHSGGAWPKWDLGNAVASLNGAFGFQFFTHNDKNYIAYVVLPDNKHCDLVVVEDNGNFESSLAGEVVFTAPLYEGDEATCAAGNTYGDCSVVEIEGELHIVAMMQGGGLSIFKLN